uniref:Uncharacterized protein n=1 Tax=Meloidogyne enterolobii TaxID=390850 RepID=A0A6V7V6U2_MELEN|nr:unnamed protein product [Meloidogyne enterolobii]
MFPQHPQQQAQMHSQLQQRKEPQQFISAEAQAREKLSHFVYEYLVHMGASKTADMFKNEVLAHNPNIQIDVSAPPGFLSNWFSVFWDLYSVQADKKDKAEPSNDAKTYHKMIFPAGGFPEGMVNGGGIYGHPGFHNPNMGQAPGLPPPPQSQNMPDGMFPVGYFNGTRGGPQPGPSQSSNQASPIPGGPSNRFPQQQGTRSGAPTPNSFQPQHQMNAASFQMTEQMRMAFVQQQRQGVQPGRMPMNMPLSGHPGRQQIRPQFCPPQQYMDSPSGTPPFTGSITHNGAVSAAAASAMCSSSASLMSPSACVPSQQQIPHGVLMGGGSVPGQMQGPSGDVTGVGPGSADPNFMMMSAGGGPPSGMQSQFLNHNDGGNGGNPTATSIRQQIEAAEGGDLNGGGNQQQSSQLHSLLNGTGGGASGDMSMEIKHSPASVHHFAGSGSVPGTSCQQPGINGGTPTGGGGPLGSVGGPSSVHSQQSGSNNKIQQQPPISEALEMAGHVGNHQSDEISKIKAGLLEGFPQTHQFQQQ